MSTSIVLANGSLLINVDYELKITDLYYPNIGSENQLNRFSNDIFFSYEDNLIELNQSNFEINIDYKPNYLIGNGLIKSKKYPFTVSFEDYVLYDKNIFIREIELKDVDLFKNKLKIFFTQNFELGESIFADTVYYNPILNCMIHYKKNRYIAFGFVDQDFEYSCAAKSDNFGKGAIPNKYYDLDKNLIATGNVTSTISIDINNKLGNSSKSKYYLIAGKSIKDIEKSLIFLRSKFTKKVKLNLKIVRKKEVLDKLKLILPKYFSTEETEKLINLYFRSIDIIKTQIDNNGAVIASNDGQFLKVDGTDSYSYVWPRDASEVIKTLVDINEKKLAKKSLEFLLTLIDKKGFFWHKYYPKSSTFNSSIASGWQPWLSKNNNLILPIQEDGTALFIQAFEKYIVKYNDQEFLFKSWKKYIKPVIEFLVNFRFKEYGLDEFYSKFINDFPQYQKTGIIIPSFDIWEQFYGIFTYTVSQILGAYESGIKLALIIEDVEIIDKIKIAKDELYKAMYFNLFDVNTGGFFKGIHIQDKTVIQNTEADSSLVYLWKNKIFDILDSKITATMKYISEKLTVKSQIGGIARKENDNYLRISDYNNPWVISTLWMSQYYFKINDISKGKELLLWVLKHSDSTGLIGEQINPINGFSLSVKPLTWSHAEFINTINIITSLK